MHFPQAADAERAALGRMMTSLCACGFGRCVGEVWMRGGEGETSAPRVCCLRRPRFVVRTHGGPPEKRNSCVIRLEMARFERSLKTPMGEWASGPHAARSSSPFASTSAQRNEIRIVTRAGPGRFAAFGDFARYEGPPALPQQRQPLREAPRSPQIRKPTTRFVSTVSRLRNPVLPNKATFPGPGTYSLEQYSQFSLVPILSGRDPRSQPFGAARGVRSNINDVYPDGRCGVICRAPSTPSPHAYAPVPLLDRLRMSMSTPMRGAEAVGRIRAGPGRRLDSILQSKANMSLTLKDMNRATRFAESR